MATGKVTEKDYGLRRLFETAKLMTNSSDLSVKIGAFGDDSRDGIDNAALVAIHEFGSSDGRIPERSFIRSTFGANAETYVRGLKRLLERILDGRMTLVQALDVMGSKISTDIKNRVTQGEHIPPPNAPSTIERKGSDRPLVDTGRMINSITWKVER